MNTLYMNRIKTITILAAVLLLLTVAGELLLGVIFPGYVAKGHLVVPLIFFAIYATAVATVNIAHDAKQFLRQYMVFKTVKLLASLAAMLVLAFVFREQVKGVLVSFLIYYLATMILENAFVLYTKKHLAK